MNWKDIFWIQETDCLYEESSGRGQETWRDFNNIYCLYLNNQMQKIYSYALILSKLESIDEQIIKIPMYL